MARIELASLGTGVAQSANGVVVPNASGTIYVHNTLTPVTVYADEAGANPNTSGQFSTDAFGRIPGWIDLSQTVDITIAPAPTITVDVNFGGDVAAETTRALAAEAQLVPLSQKGAANGVGTLDGTNRQPIGQSPVAVVTVSSGTPTAGQVPVFTGAGNATTPGASGGGGGTGWTAEIDATSVAYAGGMKQDGAFTTATLAGGATTVVLGGFGPPAIGMNVLIAGAGTAGADLLTKIDALAGTSATLHDAVVTPVVSAIVYYGTDNAPALQAACAHVSTLRGGTVVIPNPNDFYYFFATTVTAPKWSVKLRGVGGGASNSPLLCYMGATGSLLDMESTQGWDISGITFMYCNQRYSGDLIQQEGSVGDCQQNFIHDCSFVPDGGVAFPYTANSWIRLNKVIFGGISRCVFYGASKHIQVGVANYVNVFQISNNAFSHALIGEIYMQGLDLENVIIGPANGFEPLAYGAAGGVVGGPSNHCYAPVIVDNWAGDVGAAGGSWIDGVYCAVSAGKIDGNVFFSPGATGGAVQTLSQSGSASTTWTLKYTDSADPIGQTTAAIPANATAAQVQTALRALGDIGTSAACTGGPLGTAPIVCTFSAPNAYQGIDLLAITQPTGATIAVSGIGGTHMHISGGLWLVEANLFQGGNLFDLTPFAAENPLVAFIGNTTQVSFVFTNGNLGSFGKWAAFANMTVFGTATIPDTVTNYVQASQQSGNHTFSLADVGTCVEATSATPVTFSIPVQSLVGPVGSVIEVFQFGAGQVTIADGTGGSITILSDGAKVRTAGQYATVSMRQRANNVWVLSGDLA